MAWKTNIILKHQASPLPHLPSITLSSAVSEIIVQNLTTVKSRWWIDVFTVQFFQCFCIFEIFHKTCGKSIKKGWIPGLGSGAWPGDGRTDHSQHDLEGSLSAFFLETCPFFSHSNEWCDKYTECGEGNGNPLQYSCLENPMAGGAWCRLLSTGSQRVLYSIFCNGYLGK